jgi:Zn-dependent protease with chaperone function
MDFFANQAAARRRTGLLVVYYALAVALIIASVYLAFAAVFMGARMEEGQAVTTAQWWDERMFLWVAGGTLAIVLTGTLYRIAQLAGGGKSVAQLLGGRLAPHATRDLAERKVLNVVEEMAIASGIPVPPVYLLDNEAGINAFAAGFSQRDAVIGVTRGCVEQLSRDELQGVIAHEFSHIFNGDMRLNIRLMGVLHGILVIALVGYWIMRSSFHGRARSRDSKGGAAAIGLLGVALMLIGYIGVFFGKLIQSAVSRQREFLADASAVQYTRNPGGLASALRRIAGMSHGSKVGNLHAQEAGHFFFANGLRGSLLGLLATHPPIEERIRRLEPGGETVRAAYAAMEAAGPGTGVATAGAAGFAAGAVTAEVGAPRAEHMRYAEGVSQRLPAAGREACERPDGARAAVYALLTQPGGGVGTAQRERLEAHETADVVALWARLVPELRGMSADLRLPLAESAVATLKELSGGEYRAFRDNLRALVAADREVDLFEYALQRMILRQLAPTFEGVKREPVRYRDAKSIAEPGRALLSCLAYWGSDDPEDARRAFEKGWSEMGAGATDGMAPLDQCGLPLLDRALETLAQAAPALKKRVVAACAACIGFDGRVTVEEGELLRAVADAIDCPIPPLAAPHSVRQAP